MMAPGFHRHDHRTCLDDGLARLRSYCARAGVRATPVRIRVLEILLDTHRALGAYDILERLNQEGFGSQPPVAYRALEFLQEHGFVHRVERLNAFVACTHPDKPHHPALLVCRVCRSVAETDADPVGGPLDCAARAAGFVIEHSTSEAVGLCPACARSAQESPRA